MAGCPKKRARLERWRAWSRCDEAITELCEVIANGGHLSGFAREHDFAYNTVDDWIEADTNRSAMYARARQARADKLFDEIIDDAQAASEDNPGSVAKAKLLIDTKKWAMAKMNPRYSDKLEVKHGGVVGTLDIAKGLSEQSCTAIAKEMLIESGYEFDDESVW